MSTEDPLPSYDDSLQLVIEGVRALNEHRLVMQESFRLMAEQMQRMVERQAVTDEILNRALRHLMLQNENGNQ